MEFLSIGRLKQRGQLYVMGCLGCLSCLFISCSNEEGEASEWDNWQQRNELYFASLQDSLSANAAQWQRILTYSLNTANEYAATNYIYVKKMETGSGTQSPAFTDSVRVVYQGRLIPTATYPQGYVFGGTVYGQFSSATSYTAGLSVSKTVAGMSTALQQMRCGDYWRIYIPYQLGYGTADQTNSSGVTTIPAYSTLIFDVQLVDFCAAGETLPAWSSRQRR